MYLPTQDKTALAITENEDNQDLWFIRQADLTDLSEIARIWRTGQPISTGIKVPSQKQAELWLKDRLEKQDDNFQVWVAVSDSEQKIIGWQSLCPFTQQPLINQFWAESSTYIDVNNRYRGIGHALLQHALNHSKSTSLEYVFGFISPNETVTVKLIESVGFQRLSLLPKSTKHISDHHFELICYVVPK